MSLSPLPVWVFLHHLKALQSLKDLPRHIPGAHAEVGGAHSIPLTPSVDFDHRADADPSSQVQVTSCGRWRDAPTEYNVCCNASLFKCLKHSWLVHPKHMKSNIPAYQMCAIFFCKLLCLSYWQYGWVDNMHSSWERIVYICSLYSFGKSTHDRTDPFNTNVLCISICDTDSLSLSFPF